jgi:hypothetical protein
MAFPVKLGVVRGLVKEVSTSAKDDRPLVVGGALADVLHRELVKVDIPTEISGRAKTSIPSTTRW